jgi:hypothetical protein
MITHQPRHLQQRPRALLVASEIHAPPARRLGLLPRKALLLLRRGVFSGRVARVWDGDAPDFERVDIEFDFLRVSCPVRGFEVRVGKEGAMAFVGVVLEDGGGDVVVDAQADGAEDGEVVC